MKVKEEKASPTEAGDEQFSRVWEVTSGIKASLETQGNPGWQRNTVFVSSQQILYKQVISSPDALVHQTLWMTLA
jgi:hypothetical protein